MALSTQNKELRSSWTGTPTQVVIHHFSSFCCIRTCFTGQINRIFQYIIGYRNFPDQLLEITNLITAQRAYEMNSKVIQTADDMLDTVNRLR